MIKQVVKMGYQRLHIGDRELVHQRTAGSRRRQEKLLCEAPCEAPVKNDSRMLLILDHAHSHQDENRLLKCQRLPLKYKEIASFTLHLRAPQYIFDILHTPHILTQRIAFA